MPRSILIPEDAERPEPIAADASTPPYSVLLAGGAGTRLAGLIRWVHSDGRPKQFATLLGTRSMVQHTYDRAAQISPPDRILAVLTSGQEGWASEQLDRVLIENFLVQERSLGTGPAICRSVAWIMAEDPQATVVVYPCDHFIHPEGAFRENIARAVEACEATPELKLILVGAEPGETLGEVGWILPGESAEGGLRRIRRFVEKPPYTLARELADEGAVQNTFIMVARARTFWYLFWMLRPDAARKIDRFHEIVRAGMPREVAAEVFSSIDQFDFSHSVLQRAQDHLLLFSMHGVAWQDWGTPERFFETVEEMGWWDRLDQRITAGDIDAARLHTSS